MPHARALPLIIACALFMENMDASIIATALPMIARDLGEHPIALKLALTTYYASLAVFLPASSWMASRFGARTVFQAAIGVFMLGSMLCGMSTQLGAIVASRFVQGLGGAMMVPVGRLVLLQAVDKRELVQALSWLTLPALLGPVIGPPLGGFIATHADWRWIFFVNLPIGLLGSVLATRIVPNVHDAQPQPLDALGLVWLGLGLALLTLGLATAGQHLLPWRQALACTVLGALALTLYGLHARRMVQPALPLQFLQVPTYRAGVVAGLLFRIGVGATPFLMPLMLQLGFGLDPVVSGLLTASSAVAAMFMKTLSARILKRWGFRPVMMANALVASATIGCYGLFTPLTPLLAMAGVLFIGGFFRSLQFTALNALVYADIDKEEMGPASTLPNVAQQLAWSLGISLSAAVLQAAASMRGHALLAAGDFRIAFAVVGLCSASSFFLVHRLPPEAGAELAGRPQNRASAAPPA